MSLAERTIQDVLLYFADTLKESRRRYREFVEKGIEQGVRPELQGGGLVRPACHAREGHLLSEIGVRATESGKAKRDVCEARAGRSAGGDTAGLLGRKAEEREKGDARILGSGDFVNEALHRSEKLLERKYRPKKTMDDLMTAVADKVGMSPELICSRSRQRKHSEARAVFTYLAVEETGYSAADVGRFLGVKRMSVHEAIIRGKRLCAEHARLGAGM